MLRVHFLSPQNEVRLVDALADDIRRTWPEAVADPNDRIDLLVGVRSGVDVDLLIALDLGAPRAISASRHVNAPPSTSIASGLIAVEIKQLDAARFERIGNQLFATYGGTRSERSVCDQARDAAFEIKRFAEASGFTHLYVHALAWLTQLDESELAGVDPAIVAGSSARRIAKSPTFSDRTATAKAVKPSPTKTGSVSLGITFSSTNPKTGPTQNAIS